MKEKLFLKIFIPVALATILCIEEERFVQFL